MEIYQISAAIVHFGPKGHLATGKAFASIKRNVYDLCAQVGSFRFCLNIRQSYT